MVLLLQKHILVTEEILAVSSLNPHLRNQQMVHSHNAATVDDSIATLTSSTNVENKLMSTVCFYSYLLVLSLLMPVLIFENGLKNCSIECWILKSSMGS